MHDLDWRSVPDSDLAIAATLGEFQAFDELVRRFRPAVLAVARQIVGPAQADDLAQDAFILAFKALPQLEEPERFGPWLAAITRHRALRQKQHRSSREETGHTEIDRLIIQHTPNLTCNPAHEVEAEAGREEVRAAMARLPEEFQIVLWLFYFEGMPVARISEFLVLPVTTVKWRLHRGRQLMKEQLEASSGEQPARAGRTTDERRAEHPAGDPPAGPDAGGNRKGRARREPDRPARGRESGGGAPVQRRAEPAAGIGHRIRGALLPAGRRCFV
ncbi:MAG: RNA polymerase sigma factor [Armatimonadota bacterium]